MGFVCGGVLATAVSQDMEVEVGVVVVSGGGCGVE